MLRRLLDSPKTYFILAGLFFVVGIFLTVRIEPPPRAVGIIQEI